MTLSNYKTETRKTWARIAAELTECAQARDPDKMSRIYEGRVWRLIGGAPAHDWELQALEDLCGVGVSYK